MHDVIEIDSSNLNKGIYWREIWRYRELLLVLVYRDIAVRYRQTILGVLWAVLQPLGMMVIFTVIFGRWARFDSGAVPYHLFVFAGLLPWMFFSSSLNAAGASVLKSEGLISKVYFPRLVIPIAAIGAPIVDFLVSFVLLIGFLLYSGVSLTFSIVYLPFFALIAALIAIGVGCFISALSVKYRDFHHLLPFLVSTWMFLTPIIYPPTLVPEKWQWLLALNPMAGVIGGVRSAVFATPLEPMQLLASTLFAIAVFWFGAHYFQSVEREFADVI